jgi:iron complex outermembrane recepter protein
LGYAGDAALSFVAGAWSCAPGRYCHRFIPLRRLYQQPDNMVARVGMKGKSCKIAALAGVSSLALGWASASYAQNAGVPAIEEIVVSARKTEERLQDVPIAVSAFSRATLDRKGVQDISQLSGVVAGLSYERDFGRRLDRPAIRGQSSILGTPNAASFLDGVFIPDSLFSTEMAFVERVEVIKGPQSALYGRQTFSGAISYVSRLPGEVPEGTFKATLASNGEYDVLASYGGALVPQKASLQLAANYYRYGGEYTNHNPADSYFGAKVGKEETRAGTGILRLTPIDPLTITLRLSYAKNDDGHDATALQRASKNNCFPAPGTGAFRYYCGVVTATPDDISLNLDLVNGGQLTRETTRGAGIIDYDFGPVKLTSITGYTHSDERRSADLDFLPIVGAAGTLHVRDGIKIEAFSQELRLASAPGDRLSWLVGGYYYREDRHTDRYIYTTKRRQDNGINTTRNYAGFGLIRYALTDQFSASAELRFARDELGLIGGDNRYNLSAAYNSLNPRFTLDYKLREGLMVYGTVARGNKPGGFNSDVRLTGSQVPYDEETAWNYEIGVKSDWFDRRLRVNAAAFYIDWSNQQLTQSAVFGTGSISYIANVGALEVKGVELELQAAPTNWWRLTASGSISDPVYTKGTDPEVGTLTGNPSIVGKMAPNTPKYQAYLASDFDFPLADRVNGFLSLSYQWRSEKFDQVGNFASTGDRDVVDLRLGAERDGARATFFVRNLFDNRDPLGVIRYVDFGVTGSPRGYQVGFPRGRQVGVTLETKF